MDFSWGGPGDLWGPFQFWPKCAKSVLLFGKIHAKMEKWIQALWDRFSTFGNLSRSREIMRFLASTDVNQGLGLSSVNPGIRLVGLLFGWRRGPRGVFSVLTEKSKMCVTFRQNSCQNEKVDSGALG